MRFEPTDTGFHVGPGGAIRAYLQQNNPAYTRHSIEGGRITIGRQDSNDIVLVGDMRVSRHHAVVEDREGEWCLRDLRSRNGSYLNGELTARARSETAIASRSAALSSSSAPSMIPWPRSPTLVPSNSVPCPRSRLAKKEILRLLCRGSTDQQIAEALFISLSTVRSHLDRIRDKTGCRRRSELTRLAIGLRLDS